MLHLTSVACRRDGQLLFSNASGFFARSQKVGVTGRNGCGKSSLFWMILGELDPDEGEIVLQPGMTTAHVAQETPRTEKTAIDYVMDGDQRLRQLQKKLAAMGVEFEQGSADAMSAGQDSEAAAPEMASVFEEYESVGGYTAEARAGTLLNGLGFSAEEHRLPINDFSGGWLMRLNLAQALMCPSDLLLLDEPTNHLDLDAVFWLQDWLKRYTGILMLISHDREFLDTVVDSVLHIEHQTVTRYTGNYSAFEELRAQQLANQQALYTRQQRKVEDMQRFIDRFKAKATKARQAQSRVKMLERMQRVSPAHVDSGFNFEFKEPDKLSDPLVTLSNANIGYADTTVLKKVNFQLGAGDRVALLGRNGAGKSTLVKALVGDLALQNGERTVGVNLATGYFAQHQIDQLDYSGSALQQLQKFDPELDEAETRNILGRFGFSGDMALQSVDTFSGGEKARLVLAMLVHSRPNLLLLDEPTNHLDMDMRLALSEALQTFSGALVVVSHDRFLLESVSDELWLVSDNGVRQYEDDLNGYRRWLSKKPAVAKNSSLASEEPVAGAATAQGGNGAGGASRKDAKRQQALKRQQLAPLRDRVKKAERDCEKLQHQLTELQEQLSDNELYTKDRQSELTELLKLQKKLQVQLEAAEGSWLEASEALEQAGL